MVLFRKFLRLLCCHLPLVHGAVALVADQNFTNARLRVFLNFFDPRSHILEGFAIGHIVHNDDALGSAVVTGGQSAEAFLPGRVPDLQLNVLVVMLDILQFLYTPEILNRLGGSNLRSQRQ